MSTGGGTLNLLESQCHGACSPHHHGGGPALPPSWGGEGTRKASRKRRLGWSWAGRWRRQRRAGVTGWGRVWSREGSGAKGRRACGELGTSVWNGPANSIPPAGTGPGSPPPSPRDSPPPPRPRPRSSSSAVSFQLAQECSAGLRLPGPGPLIPAGAARARAPEGQVRNPLPPPASRLPPPAPSSRPARWVTLGWLRNLSGLLKN